MSDDYPDEDFPWSFYFNGEVMPKWGASWSLAGVTSFLDLERDALHPLGHRDVYSIYCQIDHIGIVESADPDVFIYVIQEVLHILLSHRDSILTNLTDNPPDVYPGLVAAAFRMRELAAQRRCAFWTSGYEADRMRLVEVMRRCHLPADSSEFTLAPHVRDFQNTIRLEREEQIRRLHQLAQSGQFDKATRKKLHDIDAT